MLWLYMKTQTLNAKGPLFEAPYNLRATTQVAQSAFENQLGKQERGIEVLNILAAEISALSAQLNANPGSDEIISQLNLKHEELGIILDSLRVFCTLPRGNAEN